uniref:Uncharacterized protein n=1 Tax=Siphoviridae sp. ctk5O4 TaxID=2827921 RepID=A0A8S5SKN6_9CAUD|nr:MAG TPA: hypothetical protein [Siphoviridae sp. ctk5O4]
MCVLFSDLLGGRGVVLIIIVTNYIHKFKVA